MPKTYLNVRAYANGAQGPELKMTVLQSNMEGIRSRSKGLKFDHMDITATLTDRRDVDLLIEFLLQSRLSFPIAHYVPDINK